MRARARRTPARNSWLAVFAAAALAVMLGGCDSRGASSAAAGNPQEKVTSAVLTTELNHALDEFVSVPRSFARRAEPRVYDRAATLKELSESMPDFLVVTREEESRFAKGNFDDAGNRARFTKASPALDPQWGITPTFVKWMVGEDHARPLSGARLELLAHIAERESQVLAKVTQSGTKK